MNLQYCNAFKDHTKKKQKVLGYLFTSGLSSSISWVAACFAGLRISARLITLKVRT